MIAPDVSLVGDAKESLQSLLPLIDKSDKLDWQNKINTWKQEFALGFDTEAGLTMQEVFAEIDKQTNSGAVIATDVASIRCGQHNFLRLKIHSIG